MEKEIVLATRSDTQPTEKANQTTTQTSHTQTKGESQEGTHFSHTSQHGNWERIATRTGDIGIIFSVFVLLDFWLVCNFVSLGSYVSFSVSMSLSLVCL